ncbi:MAG: Glycosyl transferase group 1 [Microgenomates group bacterium GW2011_GWA2_47_8]|nr:MAG: Glycosyl transferase group 1 [Microgenomates group bacterium GW2011_GWA2_47_8]
MMIAIDGYEANVPERVGIGRYAYEILRYLYLLHDTHHTYRIYLPNSPLSDMPPETPWWQYRILQPKKLWTLFRLPFALASDRPKADVIFSPTHYIPRFTHVPKVMSIMDVSYLHYPELFKSDDLYQLTHWTAYSAAHAARIFTISEFSKGAIIKAYGVPSEKVVVTYPGLTNHKSKITMIKQDIARKYNLSDHYILSVGTLQPRKNFVRLTEAFSLFLRENKQKSVDMDLVIVGKKGWLYEEILAAPARFGVADRVKFLDYVPDEDLSVLYKEALCLALPSLYEGFGLPVLESMAMGCPVVVSQVSSLPEIAGEAGIYVDPKSTQSIANGLLVAVRERDLRQGKDRIARGLAQAKKFTWERAAKETLNILLNVGRANA